MRRNATQRKHHCNSVRTDRCGLKSNVRMSAMVNSTKLCPQSLAGNHKLLLIQSHSFDSRIRPPHQLRWPSPCFSQRQPPSASIRRNSNPHKPDTRPEKKLNAKTTTINRLEKKNLVASASPAVPNSPHLLSAPISGSNAPPTAAGDVDSANTDDISTLHSYSVSCYLHSSHHQIGTKGFGGELQSLPCEAAPSPDLQRQRSSARDKWCGRRRSG
ncbi:unnamed protein product [Linum trigynum]